MVYFSGSEKTKKRKNEKTKRWHLQFYQPKIFKISTTFLLLFAYELCDECLLSWLLSINLNLFSYNFVCSGPPEAPSLLKIADPYGTVTFKCCDVGPRPSELLMSCTTHVVHSSRLTPLLSCIPFALYPTCSTFLMSCGCTPPVMHSSCPAPLLSCILHALHPSCHAFVMSCILLSCVPPVLHPYCQTFLGKICKQLKTKMLPLLL